jgi:long-chain acyl-CoA synthetase
MVEQINDHDTFPKLLLRNYRRWPNEVAMRQKDFGIWQEYTWKDSYEKVKHLSLGLISLGLRRGDKVAIIGENEPEWFCAQFAIQAAGGWGVGIFVDMMPAEVKFVVEHSDSSLAVANDQEQVDKFLQVKKELPKLQKVIHWDPRGLSNYDDPILMSFSQLLKLGKEYEEAHPRLFEENVSRGKGEDIAQLYYTSGTSGVPKAVMVSHKALLASGTAFRTYNPVHQGDDWVSLFPAAWITEGMFVTSTHLLAGTILNFAEEPETVRNDLREIAPTMLGYGPRQWESECRMIQVKMHDAGFIKRLAYNLAMPLGQKRAELAREGKKPNLFWKLMLAMADAIVFHPLRDKLGMSEARIALTGSAAMSIDTFKMWSALGLNLKQTYGSTESGYAAGHNEGDVRFETIGPPVPGYEIRIHEDGEILTRGSGTFQSYYKDQKKAEEALDKQRWFHTGDAGYINPDGHLVFLDRVSDLVELSTNIKYAPQYLEGRLRFSPYIKDAMTIGGADKSFVSVILIIDFESVGKWAEDNHINYTTFVDLSQKREVGQLVLQDIKRVNVDVPEGGRIKKYVLLHKEFDPDEAELTRTRKLRRGFMTERYQTVIESIYGGKPGVEVEANVTYRDGRKGVIKTMLNIWSIEEEQVNS